MFNIKVFPDFRPGPADSRADLRFLGELQRARKVLGARYLNISVHNHAGTGVHSIHFLTYPLTWISHYVTHFYTNSDPLLQLDWRSISFVDWAEVHAGDGASEILEAFSRHGLGSNGATACCHIARDMYCVLSASFDIAGSDWPAFKNNHIDLMRFEANKLGDAYLAAYESGMRRQLKLTPRECECLYWVAMGKTDDQISEILSIGRWTVIGHLQSARTKLGSTSRAAAVAQAIVSGLIDVRRAG